NVLTFGADDNGGERSGNRRARGHDRWAKGNFATDAGETVVVVRRLVRQVIVLALVLNLEQEELAIIHGITIVIEVLSQFEGVTRQHGATVAGTLERLALYFQSFKSMPHQRFAICGRTVAVMTGKVVDFVGGDIALGVEAGHADRQWIARLPVIECLDGHPAGLQNPMAAPSGDRVGGLGDRRAVVADPRLLYQRLKVAGVVADDQAVFFLRMCEIEEQPFMLQQAQDETQIALTVLRDVAVA